MIPFVINCNPSINSASTRAKLQPMLYTNRDLTMHFVPSFLLAGLLLAGQPTLASSNEAPAAANSRMPDTPDNVELVDINQWQLGVAIGIGRRTSVVHGQEDLPLYLIPTVKYYGEQIFFDNGTLSFTLLEDANTATSLVTELNPLAAQFYDYHPENMLFDNAISSDVSVPEQDFEMVDSDSPDPDSGDQAEPDPDTPAPSVDSVALKRPRWSLDLGLQHNWFINQQQMLVSQIFTDASNLHNGYRIELLWSYSQRLPAVSPGLKAQLKLGGQLLDKETSQYYYGIDERHTSDTELRYRAKASFNSSVSLTLTQSIGADFKLITFYKQQHLDTRLYSSPKISSKQIETLFLGVHYDF